MAAKYDPTGILVPIGAGSGGITQARGTGAAAVVACANDLGVNAASRHTIGGGAANPPPHAATAGDGGSGAAAAGVHAHQAPVLHCRICSHSAFHRARASPSHNPMRSSPIPTHHSSSLQVPDYVDPESVSFALCRVPIGSGAFKREKFILLNYNLGAWKGGGGVIVCRGHSRRRRHGCRVAAMARSSSSPSTPVPTPPPISRFICPRRDVPRPEARPHQHQEVGDQARAGGGCVVGRVWDE